MKQPGDQWVVEVDANIDGLERSLDEAARVGERFAGKLVSAFDAVVVRGRSVESVVKDLALGLSKLALGEALKPLQGALGSLFGQLFSGLAFGKGGVFQSGSPTAFAKGGVISSPTLFPLAGGRAGLAGERGVEAIMPLARAADGSLGVRADGNRSVTVNVHIATPDVEGFRRSQSQLAASLGRAIAHAQRNL